MEMTVHDIAQWMIDHMSCPEACDSDHDMFYGDSLAEALMNHRGVSFEYACAWVKEYAPAIIRELDVLGYESEWIWRDRVEDSVFYVFFAEDDYEVDEEWGLF